MFRAKRLRKFGFPARLIIDGVPTTDRAIPRLLITDGITGFQFIRLSSKRQTDTADGAVLINYGGNLGAIAGAQIGFIVFVK